MDGIANQSFGLPQIETPAVTVDDARAALAKLAAAVAATPDAAARATDTDPTPAQQEAGNYRKGKVRVHGLLVSIENPRGSTRTGTGSDGKEWSVTMAHHYGYLQRSEGNDGDPVDCFVGPDTDSDTVFVVNQTDPSTGDFDEHKVMLGFLTEADARAGYLASYEKGWKGLGSIRLFTVEQFKNWFLKGDHGKRAADERGDLHPVRQSYGDPAGRGAVPAGERRPGGEAADRRGGAEEHDAAAGDPARTGELR